MPGPRYPVLIQLKARRAQAQRLKRLADREDTTMSALLRRALDRYLEQEERRSLADTVVAGATAKAAG